jgi:hypothetical protein
MIFNEDGKPYSVAGTLKQFDDTIPERSLFNDWDAESIRQGGSPINYHEVFIDTNTIDPIYLEARGKLFSQNPVELYCFYEPVPSQNLQSAFGLDSPDEMIFEFNYYDVLQRIGYAPKIGSRFHTPFLNEDWVIVERKLGEFKMYQATRLQCICSRFQEDLVSGSSVAKEEKSDFKIN